MVRLDWQLEGERNPQPAQRYQDDPIARRRGWRTLGRLLLLIGLIVGLALGAAWLLNERLRQVEERDRQLLSDSIAAEIASLRIGEFATFIARQRSASPDWLLAQEALFKGYQAQKSSSDLRLTGNIVNMTIERQRARVQIEEIQDGIPYLQTWFYWRYDDETMPNGEVLPAGWYHVPPDYTFWGDPMQSEGAQYTLRYQALDAPYATEVNAMLASGFGLACGFLRCDVPRLTLDVLPAPISPRWADASAVQLLLGSPYAGRARADQPLSDAERISIATLLVTRLVEHNVPPLMDANSDAAFLRQSLLAWLVGRWVQRDAGATLLESIASNYGNEALMKMIPLISAGRNISLLNEALGADLAATPLDWRDFFAWRLNTEARLISERQEAAWLSLVDTRSAEALASAYARYNAAAPAETYEVLSLTPQSAADGTPQLLALVRVSGREEQIPFNLVNQLWLRAN